MRFKDPKRFEHHQREKTLQEALDKLYTLQCFRAKKASTKGRARARLCYSKFAQEHVYKDTDIKVVLRKRARDDECMPLKEMAYYCKVEGYQATNQKHNKLHQDPKVKNDSNNQKEDKEHDPNKSKKRKKEESKDDKDKATAKLAKAKSKLGWCDFDQEANWYNDKPRHAECRTETNKRRTCWVKGKSNDTLHLFNRGDTCQTPATKEAFYDGKNRDALEWKEPKQKKQRVESNENKTQRIGKAKAKANQPAQGEPIVNKPSQAEPEKVQAQRPKMDPTKRCNFQNNTNTFDPNRQPKATYSECREGNARKRCWKPTKAGYMLYDRGDTCKSKPIQQAIVTKEHKPSTPISWTTTKLAQQQARKASRLARVDKHKQVKRKHPKSNAPKQQGPKSNVSKNKPPLKKMKGKHNKKPVRPQTPKSATPKATPSRPSQRALGSYSKSPSNVALLTNSRKASRGNARKARSNNPVKDKTSPSARRDNSSGSSQSTDSLHGLFGSDSDGDVEQPIAGPSGVRKSGNSHSPNSLHDPFGSDSDDNKQPIAAPSGVRRGSSQPPNSLHDILGNDDVWGASPVKHKALPSVMPGRAQSRNSLFDPSVGIAQPNTAQRTRGVRRSGISQPSNPAFDIFRRRDDDDDYDFRSYTSPFSGRRKASGPSEPRPEGYGEGFETTDLLNDDDVHAVSAGLHDDQDDLGLRSTLSLGGGSAFYPQVEPLHNVMTHKYIV